METIVFKTNMKCSGCIEKLTPALNELAGKDHWFADLLHPDKTRTVQGENIPDRQILSTVEKAVFRIKKMILQSPRFAVGM